MSQPGRYWPPDGITPIINTPFDSEMRLDVPSIGRLIERSIADGVTGCIVPAVASEVSKLTPGERGTLLETVVAAAGGRIAVVAGVSSEELDVATSLTEHALRVGCDAILCQTPRKLAGDDRAIISWFEELSRTGMNLLMIQDLDWGGPGMDVELIVELVNRIPAFRALKVESVPAGVKYTQVRNATVGRLHISCGWGLLQMIEALDRGVNAFTSTAVNRPFVRIYDLYHSGRRSEAVALFNRLLPFLAWTLQHIDVSIHVFKRYCHRQAVFTTANVRQPSGPWDETHERICDELLDDLQGLEDDIGPTLVERAAHGSD